MKTLHGGIKKALGNKVFLTFNHILNKGWRVYITPPYFPEFQPIEYVWNHGTAQVKKNAATHDYTREAFRQHANKPFGDISVDTIRHIIRAAEKEIEERGQRRNILAQDGAADDPSTIDYQSETPPRVRTKVDKRMETEALSPVQQMRYLSSQLNDAWQCLILHAAVDNKMYEKN
ncbi:MAG: hypothetical protein Q7U84_07695 [Polynucleobacter sp.]|nr:hypothetical protein [Polynucleobacter sp.]